MASAQEVKRVQKGAKVGILNQTDATMKLDRSHIWAGLHIGVTFPPTISPKSEGTFVHPKGNDTAAKAMVQYSGFNPEGLHCAWVLAWDVPGDMSMLGSKNKVYATGGVKRHIDALTTDEILARLETGISPPGPFPSPAGADAIIAELPDMAAIQARFYFNKM